MQGHLALLAALLVSTSVAWAVDCPTGGVQVISTECDLQPGPNLFTSLTIALGGKVNCRYDAALDVGVTIRTTDLTVQLGGQLFGSGLGEVAGAGLGGQPNRGTSDASGASHGGPGGQGSGTYFGPYGSVTMPVLAGSGGGSTSYCTGGAGGSAFKIEVTGTLDVSGTIVSNGLSYTGGTTRTCGSGAGGSIWIVANNMQGNGLISADGGTGGNGGSGGRVAIESTTSTYSGQVRALGGYSGQMGAEGTVFFRRGGLTELFIDGGRTSRNPLSLNPVGAATVTSTVSSDIYSFDKINIIRFGRVRFADAPDTVIVTEPGMAGDGSGQLCADGLINASSVDLVTGFGLCTSQTGTLILSSGTVTFSNTVNTIRGTITGPSNIIVNTGGVLELTGSGKTPASSEGTYVWNSLSLSGATSQLQVVGDTTLSRGVTLQLATATIGTSTSVNGIARGFPVGQGPSGIPNQGTSDAPGPGHGGTGGIRASFSAGTGAYGLSHAPVTLGSGGGGTSYCGGGNGGSAVRLNVSGTLTVDGSVSVDGSSAGAATRDCSGGSGGSIWIEAGVFSGSGTISAIGGSSGGNAGGAGGGRIAITYATSTFIGITIANGGSGFEAGGAGTIVFQDSTTGWSKLLIDNADRPYPRSLAPQQYAVVSDPLTSTRNFDVTEVVRKGFVHFTDPSDVLIVDGTDLVGDGTGQLCSSGVLNASTLASISNVGLCSLNGGRLVLRDQVAVSSVRMTSRGVLFGAHDLTVNPQAVFELWGTSSTSGEQPGVHVFGPQSRWVVRSAASLLFMGDTINDRGATVRVNSLTVDAGGTLGGLGYPTSSGGGKGGIGNTGTSDGGGAGHAGVGGFAGTRPGGASYGSATAPTFLGSATGGTSYVRGSFGGAAIKLETDSLTVNGLVDAKGQVGAAATRDAGGGSGGSIWIISGVIAGAGVIDASGGAGAGSSGGGSGGRIALYYETLSFTGEIRASGGAAISSGSNGTIYYETITINRTTTTTTGSNGTTGELPAEADASSSTGSIVSEPLYIGIAFAFFMCLVYVGIAIGCFARRRKRKQRAALMEVGGIDLPGSPQATEYKPVSISGSPVGNVELASGGRTPTEYSNMTSAGGSPVGSGEYNIAPFRAESVRSNSFRADSVRTSSSGKLSFLREDTAKFIIPFEELQLGPVIGTGSFGTVSRGKWRNGEVAIKQLSKPLSQLSQSEQDDFRSEASLLCSLRPFVHVVQFFGMTSNPTCLVTEFLAGGSLHDALRNRKFSAPAQLKIAQGIAAGMQHLAGEGIVHRDLAARNVLLSSDDVPKVTDFGMSRVLLTDSGDRSGKTENNVGPLRWMAPESMLLRTYSEKTDVWSFGCVLVEIATGDIPHPDKDAVQVSSLVIADMLHLSLPANAPGPFQTALPMTQARDPNTRATFAQISSVLA